MTPNTYKDENGELHRPWQDGPAITDSDGYQIYCEHGKLHRPVSDGPARIHSTDGTEYWENDILLWTVEP